MLNPRTIVVVLLAYIQQLSAQTITTVTGTGGGGFSGDGGQATNATISAPTGVGVDASGNIYIADFNNNAIRKVTVATGIITTVAGTSAAGYTGDGGQATAATLNAPEVVVVDAAGNIYEVEQNNNCVRKITVATGIITTVVGTSGNSSGGYNGDGIMATTAQLNNPQGVAVDAAGNVYVADQVNNRIRKATASTGLISTVAGNGGQSYSGDGGQATNATLNWPASVDIDNSGNIYIADYYNNAIRKVTVATGIITTVAGNGGGGYSGDGGQATAAQLNQPYGVNVYGTGDFLIADYANNAIRRVLAATGVITTIAGGNGAGFSGDGGAATAAQINGSLQAVDYNSTVYIADWNNNRIRKVTNIPLPVSLLYFTGSYNNRSVLLSWATATEINNKYFTVERSVNGKAFSEIATVNGAGNSTLTLNYSSVDESPIAGTDYYRLKQTDFDGNSTYSNVVTVVVTTPSSADINLFPNPVNNNLAVNSTSKTPGLVMLQVLDITTGKQLATYTFNVAAGSNTFVVNMNDYANGIYLMQITDTDGGVTNRKFVKIGN